MSTVSSSIASLRLEFGGNILAKFLMQQNYRSYAGSNERGADVISENGKKKARNKEDETNFNMSV